MYFADRKLFDLHDGRHQFVVLHDQAQRERVIFYIRGLQIWAGEETKGGVRGDASLQDSALALQVTVFRKRRRGGGGEGGGSRQLLVYCREVGDQSSTQTFEINHRIHHLGADPVGLIGHCGGLGRRGDAGSVPWFGDRPWPGKRARLVGRWRWGWRGNCILAVSAGWRGVWRGWGSWG